MFGNVGLDRRRIPNPNKKWGSRLGSLSRGRLIGQQADAKPEQEMHRHMFGNVGLDRHHMPNPNKK